MFYSNSETFSNGYIWWIWMLGQSFYRKITERTLQGSRITRTIAETNIPRTLFSVAPIRRLIPFLEYITREGTSGKALFFSHQGKKFKHHSLWKWLILLIIPFWQGRFWRSAFDSLPSLWVKLKEDNRITRSKTRYVYKVFWLIFLFFLLSWTTFLCFFMLASVILVAYYKNLFINFFFITVAKISGFDFEEPNFVNLYNKKWE